MSGSHPDPIPNHSQFYLLASAVGQVAQDLLWNGQFAAIVVSEAGLTLNIKRLAITNTGSVSGILKLVPKAQVVGLPAIPAVFEFGLASGASQDFSTDNFGLPLPAGYSFQAIGTTRTFDVNAVGYYSEG